MRQIRAPRTIAIARREDEHQPAAIAWAMGIIVMLMLFWTAVVL
jgi:hypothetical protein